METEYLTHFGVYGIALKQSQLLCIRKNSGPYAGRFDLPGGTQEAGEGLSETLLREVLEETGYVVKRYTHNRVYDTFVYDETIQKTTHHIFALYDVECSSSFEPIPEKVNDGMNDSNGADWIELMRLNEFNASPLVLKVIDEVEDSQDILEKSVFNNWKINR